MSLKGTVCLLALAALAGAVSVAVINSADEQEKDNQKTVIYLRNLTKGEDLVKVYNRHLANAEIQAFIYELNKDDDLIQFASEYLNDGEEPRSIDEALVALK